MTKSITLLTTSIPRTMMLACCAAAICAAPMKAQATPSATATQEAQPPAGPRHSPAQMEQQRLDRMTRELNLTPDQVTKVQGVMTVEREQMKALRDSSGTQPADRSQMMAIRADGQAKLRAILTDDQRAKLATMQQRPHDHMQRGTGPDSSSPTPPPTPQS